MDHIFIKASDGEQYLQYFPFRDQPHMRKNPCNASSTLFEYKSVRIFVKQLFKYTNLREDRYKSLFFG